MEVSEMARRYRAYDAETNDFLFRGGWVDMTWNQRDARQQEIDDKHGYRHGWIIVDGKSFNRADAFPGEAFVNVWD
jgi:hypothetical protein